jgi:CubicO group peptidase (beta-lactamase class C family)
MISRLAGLRFVDPHLLTPGAPGWCHATVPAGGDEDLPTALRPLRAQVAGAGRTRGLEEWVQETGGTSLLVVDRGDVVHEWYADGLGPETLFLGASMTKSALAHLVGVAVTSGVLGIDDPVTAHVPELAGSGYDGTTVEHLLTMTTGVDWVEDHRDPDSLASRLLACFADATGDSRQLLTTVRARFRAGEQYEYCTADSQVLDWVRERATGDPYPVALRELWRTLGCTSDAAVATDGPGGVAMAGGGLAATARDWARVGLLEVDGTCDGRRVLDPVWVERSAVPSRPFLAPGRLPSGITTHAGFGFHWWPLDADGRTVTADGSRGQLTYVDRDTGVVVVKTSQWPYDDWLADRQSRDLSYLGLPRVAEAAVEARTASPADGRTPHQQHHRKVTP